MKTRRILRWICDSPSPYNAALFRALGSDDSIDLTVYFVHRDTLRHPWKGSFTAGFKSVALKTSAGIDWGLVKSAVTEKDGYLIVGGWREPTLQMILLLRRGPFAIWTDTPNMRSKRNPIKAELRSRFLRKVFHRAHSVMGTGTPAMVQLEKMGCPSGKLINFPYFIDVKDYVVACDAKSQTRHEFFSCGRLAEEKGYDLALRALATIFKDRGERFRYRIAGTGPEGDNLHRLAVELGIEDSVEFLGWIEPAELSRIYSQADYFLHPARSEPYGVAILEAMASGLVVIGSDATAAVLDRVRNGENGFIHDSENPQSLVKCIAAALSDPNGTASIKSAARITAEKWPLSRAVDVVNDLIERARQ
jgi:glycosyltransferase involved in cell wall biosynthesis